VKEVVVVVMDSGEEALRSLNSGCYGGRHRFEAIAGYGLATPPARFDVSVVALPLSVVAILLPRSRGTRCNERRGCCILLVKMVEEG